MTKAGRALIALALLIAAGGVLAWRVDPNAYKPRIEAAVARATGRTLSLNGGLGLRLLPALALTAGEVGLSNPPGFSRPEMLHAAGLRARIAVLPLLRGELRITRLTLLRPDILLETDAAGEGNWRFVPPVHPGSARAAASGGHSASRTTVALDAVRIEDGTIGWRDGRTGRALAVRVARLDAGSAAAEAPVSLTAQGAFRATPFRLSANLPPLRDLLVSAKLSAPSAVSLQVGAADLADYAPGLKLTRLDVSAPAMDQPLQTALEGSYAGAPLSLTATLSPATALLPGAASPLALKVSAGAAGGTMMMQGSIAHPAALSGIDLAVAATVPDLAGLGPLLHRALPPLTDISFQGGLTDSGGSLRTGLTLAGARLSLPQGDLAGDVTLGFGETPSLRAALAATRIDADGLLKLLAARQAAPPAVPVEVAAPGPRPSPERVIPDRPLPFDALRRGDADLQLGAATLTQGRLTYRDVSLHLVLAGGHLHVEPISGQIAGSRVDGRLDVDLSRQPPPVSLVLQAPGVALQPLLAELGLPGEATGSLAVDADLHGAGETLHRIAARLDGHLGLSMVNGSVDNRLLDALFGALVRSGQLPPGLLGKDGRSDVRCLAARLDASHGVVAARALLLDSTRFRAAASGLVNLDDEALALRLRPFVKVGGSGLVVPLRVGGTLAAPLLELDPSAAEGTATAPPPGHGPGDALLGAAETGDCAPALALARDGRPGPTPAPEKPAKGADLLRGLFH